MNDFFNTLGIEATKEEKKIKKAYRARIHAVNQEGRRARKSFSGRGIYFPVLTALQRFLSEN